MATSKTRTTTKKTTAVPPAEPVEENIEVVTEQPAPKRVEKKEPAKAEIDPNQTVYVINGFNGRLVYKSKRTGERFVWENMGDEQEMELKELRNAKNSSKGFFINNWFMFGKDDQWVIDYLALSQYYRDSIPIDDYDKILMSNYKIIESKLASIPSGQKASLASRARTLIANGDIDSNKSIATLEEVLGAELVER